MSAPALPARVLLALAAAYGVLYFGRSDLPIAAPELLADPALALDKRSLGGIASLGTLCLALGKPVGGALSDARGGRGTLLLAMSLSGALTLAIAAWGTRSALLVLWPLNALAQAMAWPAVASLIAQHAPRGSTHRAFSLVALSYFFGDGLVRVILSGVAGATSSWRAVFASAGLFLALAAAIASRELLRASGASAGPPAWRPERESAAADLWRDSRLWLACGLSAVLTLVRECMGTWAPTWLVEDVGVRPALAGALSAAIPCAGGVGLWVLSARLDGARSARRGRTAAAWLAMGALALSANAAPRSPFLAIVSLALPAFALLGVYGWVTGALAHELGGARRGSTAVGWVDGAGYLAGSAAGRWFGGFAQDHGWSTAWIALASLVGIAAVAAGAHGLAPRAGRG